MKRSNSTFTAFHNHPEETDFSLDDLKQLIMHDKIKLLILCTNSCRYCSAIYKPESFTVRETQALFHLFDKYMKKNNVDGHCDAKFFINKLQEQGKLLYYYAMNRRVKNETKTISSTYIK